MKFFVIIFIVCVLFIVLLYPFVNRERQCYEISRVDLDQISSNVLNRGLSRDMECSQSMDVLYNLETCMQDATKSSTIAKYGNDTIQRLVAIIRPYAKNLWTMKAEHNQACADFSWYQLP